MCDPTVLAVASTVAGIGGQAFNYMGQMNAQNKQEDEYNAWAAQQSKNRNAENVRQEGMRQQAEAARQQGVQDIGAEEQKKRQAEEEARLGKYLQGQDQQAAADPSATPVSAADKNLLSGQGAGEPQFQSDLAAKISSASASAAQRIKALATTSSYGGSFGGLDTTNQEALATSGRGIDKENDFRRNSLKVYGIEQDVNPKQISYTPSPIAGISQTLLGLGTQGLGSMFGKAVTPIGGAAAAAPRTIKYGNVNYTGF